MPVYVKFKLWYIETGFWYLNVRLGNFLRERFLKWLDYMQIT